jgi:hypothetical protein
MQTFDLHTVFDPQHAFLDFGQLVAVRIFEEQGLAHPQRFAIDFEYSLPLLVLDPEIIAYGDHLLAHLVAFASPTWAPKLAIILALVTPFFSFASHSFNLLLMIWKWFMVCIIAEG